MKLSKTSEYALRILSFMAKDANRSYSAKYLVEKLNISDKYLRRLMTDLTKAELICSKQGRKGGYQFAKNINNITIYQIIDAVEGMEKYSGCIMGFDDCSDEHPCSMHIIWSSMRDRLIKTFKNTTLADLKISDTMKY